VMCWPSLLSASDNTSDSWPISVFFSSPVWMFQTF
jgi:hypothetical protein